MISNIEYRDLGNIEYKTAWDLQEELFNKVVACKKENENLLGAERKVVPGYLLFCEHPHVYTLGKSGDEQNLLINYIQLQAKNATFFRINRGGDITYHGPGQLVAYPILNLEDYVKGAREYIEKLEEVIIRTIALFGLRGERLKGATGVWLDTDVPGKTRKICAIGVRTSHWVSMHGFAFNVNTDLSYFGHINPCGFTDKTVTSLEKELGHSFNMEEIKQLVKSKFVEVFGFEL